MSEPKGKERAQLFVAQTARPSSLTPLDRRLLTPFQRALLVIDGTVTQFIEAYRDERVEVTCLRQERRTLDAYEPWLDAPEGTEIIVRDVRLRGFDSGTVYAYGTSLIAPERLEEELLCGVDMAMESLGRLMRGCRIETHRELLWHGLESGEKASHPGIEDSNGDFISRTYRMIGRGRPLMVITERFPLNSNG